jgi:hypothetical protein
MKAKLYQELFIALSGDQEERFKPGVLVFMGWGLTRRVGPQFQAYIEAQQKQIALSTRNSKTLHTPT